MGLCKNGLNSLDSSRLFLFEFCILIASPLISTVTDGQRTGQTGHGMLMMLESKIQQLQVNDGAPTESKWQLCKCNNIHWG